MSDDALGAVYLTAAEIKNRIDQKDRVMPASDQKRVDSDLISEGAPPQALRNPPPFAQAKELEARLRKTVKGEVRFDSGSRAMYSTDASNYRQVPIGVVIPSSVED